MTAIWTFRDITYLKVGIEDVSLFCSVIRSVDIIDQTILIADWGTSLCRWIVLVSAVHCKIYGASNWLSDRIGFGSYCPRCNQKMMISVSLFFLHFLPLFILSRFSTLIDSFCKGRKLCCVPKMNTHKFPKTNKELPKLELQSFIIDSLTHGHARPIFFSL